MQAQFTKKMDFDCYAILAPPYFRRKKTPQARFFDCVLLKNYITGAGCPLHN
jgi:hypothetical protein